MITNPTPQRALRGHLPPRATLRAAATADHLAHLAQRLQPRDRWLAGMLFEHKVLTSHHIAQLAWPSARAANLRLLQLYRWRVVDRFQPFVTVGSAPMHYVLDLAGAHILAREHGIDVKTLGYRRDREIGRAHSLRLAHTIGINGLFTALVAQARQPHRDSRLTAWWSETRCARYFGDLVRPDAYGRWRDHHQEIEWFLEFDFGTEKTHELAAKLTGYQRLAAITGIITPVLVWLLTTRRETAIRNALTTAIRALNRPHLVPVATTAGDLLGRPHVVDPDEAHWLPIGTSAQLGRLTLTDLTRAWPTFTAPSTSASHPQCTPSGQSATRPARHGLLPPPPMPPQQPAYPLPK